MIEKFKEIDTQVLGISVDSKECHENWAKSFGGISYHLLEDYNPKGIVSSSYGVYNESKGFAKRSTVIIDKRGIVQFSELAEGERDIDFLLNECKRINSLV